MSGRKLSDVRLAKSFQIDHIILAKLYVYVVLTYGL